MVRRSERPSWEEKDRRVTDRRQHSRRQSDTIRVWLKYLAIAVVTAVVLETFRR